MKLFQSSLELEQTMMSPLGKVTVIIADDTSIAREGCKRILETSNDIQVIGEAITAHQAVQDAIELKPDVVLMDLLWYGDEVAGRGAILEMKKLSPAVKIIAITAYNDLIRDARQAGADSALSKTVTREQLITEILTQANRTTVSPTSSSVSTLIGKMKQFFQKFKL